MKNIQNFIDLKIITTTFIFSLLNELFLWMIVIFILINIEVKGPVFFSFDGYYLFDNLNPFIFIIIQFVFISGFFNLLTKLKFIERNFHKLLATSFIITILSYFTSTPKNLNTFHFFTNYIFPHDNFSVIIFHILTLFISSYFFIKSFLSKK